MPNAIAVAGIKVTKHEQSGVATLVIRWQVLGPRAEAWALAALRRLAARSLEEMPADAPWYPPEVSIDQRDGKAITDFVVGLVRIWVAARDEERLGAIEAARVHLLAMSEGL